METFFLILLCVLIGVIGVAQIGIGIIQGFIERLDKESRKLEYEKAIKLLVPEQGVVLFSVPPSEQAFMLLPNPGMVQ